MPNHQDLIRERLGKLALGTRREEEILRELSDHLEDHTNALEARGVANEDAFQEALGGVEDWSNLREEICRAENEEATMNFQVTYRTKVLWLPALGALTLSSILLAIFQFSGLVPRFYWLSRTGPSMEPFFTVYPPWLIVLPAIGAVAAFWSQRAGGNAIHRLLAALALPIGMLGTFLLIPFLSLLIYILILFFLHGTGQGRVPFTLHAPPMLWMMVMIVSWVLLPAIGLAIGALPLLRKPKSHQSSVLSCP
jgi:hypothetical protein